MIKGSLLHKCQTRSDKGFLCGYILEYAMILSAESECPDQTEYTG